MDRVSKDRSKFPHQSLPPFFIIPVVLILDTSESDFEKSVFDMVTAGYNAIIILSIKFKIHKT